MSVRLSVLVLSGLVLATFGSTLGYGFAWDDEVLIARNAKIRGERALANALVTDFWDTSLPADAVRWYWRPAVKVSHVLLRQLGGESAMPFHALNIALHLGCVLLVFQWLRRRTIDGPGGAGDLAPLLGAALFAVHVSRFETVPWVACSTELMMTLFVLLAVRALESERWWWLAGPLSLLAVLSKETAAVLPLLALLEPLGRGTGSARDAARRLVATGAGVGGAFLLRLAVGVAFPPTAWPSSLGETAIRGAGILATYLERTVLPVVPTVLPLEMSDAAGVEGHLGVWPVLTGALVLLVAGASALRALRAPRWRGWVADLGWWLVPLLPVLRLVSFPSISAVSDRYLFLPVLGLAALLVRLWGAVPVATRRSVGLAMAGLVAAHLVQLVPTLPAWRSSLDLFQREVSLHPRSVFALRWYAGQLVATNAPLARQRLLLRIVKLRPSAQAGAWSLGHLANATLELTSDADRAQLTDLLAFYDGILADAPVSLRLGGQPVVLPHAEPLLPALHGRMQIDDVALHAALASLRLGQVDDAAARLARLVAQKPTERRLVGLAKAVAARETVTAALGILEQAPPRARGAAWADVRGTLERAGQRLRPAAEPLDRVALLLELGLPGLAEAALPPGVEGDAALILRARIAFALDRPESALDLLSAPGASPEVLEWDRRLRQALRDREAEFERQRQLSPVTGDPEDGTG